MFQGEYVPAIDQIKQTIQTDLLPLLVSFGLEMLITNRHIRKISTKNNQTPKTNYYISFISTETTKKEIEN